MRNIKILLICLILLLSGCRSKKSAVEKKEKSVNELQQNDVSLSEQEIEKKDILRISSSESWSFEPADNSRPAQVISGNDTLNFTNTRIRIESKQEQESDQSERTVNSSLNDHSSKSLEIQEKEKKKDKHTKSASWGLNLGLIFLIIAIAIMIYLRLKTGGLNFKSFFRIKR